MLGRSVVAAGHREACRRFPDVAAEMAGEMCLVVEPHTDRGGGGGLPGEQSLPCELDPPADHVLMRRDPEGAGERADEPGGRRADRSRCVPESQPLRQARVEKIPEGARDLCVGLRTMWCRPVSEV
jgi:hypothetical protein